MVTDVGTKSLSYEKEWPEPATITVKDAAQSFMKRILDVHTAFRAMQCMTNTFVKGDTNAIDHKLEPL